MRLLKCFPHSPLPIPFSHSPLNPFQEGFCFQYSTEIPCVRFPVTFTLVNTVVNSQSSSYSSSISYSKSLSHSWILSLLISGSQLLLALLPPQLTPLSFAAPSSFMFPKTLLQNFIVSHNILDLDFGLRWLLYFTQNWQRSRCCSAGGWSDLKVFKAISLMRLKPLWE